MTVHRLETPFQNNGHRELDFAIARLVGGLKRIWSAIQARRSINQLLKWDDRMLGDIGITRGDVVSSLSGSITEHPGLRLSRLANERRTAALAARRRHIGSSAYAPTGLGFERCSGRGEGPPKRR